MATKKRKVVDVDEIRGLIDKLLSLAPTGASAGTWEVASTKDLVLSSVKYVLTTGIDAFDDVVGGMPIGRMVELYGLESCGKTALAIRCAARGMSKHISEVIRNEDDTFTYKAINPDECKTVVVYIDNEQSLDDDGKLEVGGQKLDVIGCRFDTTDDMFKAIDASITYQEKRMESEAEDGIKRFMLIVVDTIASTSTKEELETAWGKQDYPRQALQISKALRQLTRRVNRANVCILFTNQVRTSFKAQAQGGSALAIKADDYTSPGGMALRFYCSHRVFMYSMAQKYKLTPDAQFSAGLLVGFYTKKNRLRPPLRDGRMVLLFDKTQGGLHDVFSKLETLVFFGFVGVTAEKEHTGYVMKFKSNGIVPTTFSAASTETTLDEDEEAPVARRNAGSRKDPGFKFRSEWPKFYEDHKADIELLWAAAIKYAMATEGLEGGLQIEEEDKPVAVEPSVSDD